MKLFAAVTFLSLLTGALAENKCVGDPNGYGTCTINGVTKPCIDEPCDDKADGECAFDEFKRAMRQPVRDGHSEMPLGCLGSTAHLRLAAEWLVANPAWLSLTCVDFVLGS
ncbi:unnamed protein product [Zymoseptoria tritici ST99CH_1A5]|uniref:Extracellular membrane protein CFEM domain-containing protein n=1 Tax=Zymoseptoria tritici ST99CH_1A5 TaxID=1276529 RepID=A0A1Y6LID8_ZYMTR|nr:unnamed protein product [Zymoseptoria tritici ST99CH_1A5]